MTHGRDRRRFLVVASSALAAATCALACSSKGNARAPASGPIAFGNVSKYPLGSLTQAPDDQPVVLGHDAGGIFALSTICSHQQCDMLSDGTIDPSGLSCDCHGSRFDGNGLVTHGPATRPLDHYRVDIDATGNAIVQAGTIVPVSARFSAAAK